jgi:DNA-binding transcriptional LysR family regulator
MQFESLKVFCDVARHRSFSQAARAHGVTQSAASQVVSQLEKHLGVQLIDRSTRPLQLTPFGQLYLEGCSTLLEQYMELEASIRTAHAAQSRTVRVAAIYSVGLSDMGHFVHDFHEEHPEIRIHLEYHHPDRVYEKVREGTADLGLVSFPRKLPKLVAVPWREEPMVLACSPVHPLAPNLSVRPAQLQGVQYIHFDKDLVIRREVDRFLREHGVNVEVVLEFDNVETIKKAVELGAGVALLPEPTLRREVEEHSLVARPLHGARLVRPLGIIHRRHLKPTNSACRFMEMLCTVGAVGAEPSAGRGAARRRGRAEATAS